MNPGRTMFLTPTMVGEEGFEYVLDMIQAACPNILKFVQAMS